MNLGNYASEVIDAYLATFIILGVLIFTSWRGAKRAAARLADVEAETKNG